ncbi:MAG: glycosyltransferase [bacterium]|nr:glycosyltransferase [bacterium]
MLKIFDDSHLFRSQRKSIFDGICKYIVELKKGDDNTIIYTSDLLPVRGLLFNRWIYYVTLSLILIFRNKYTIVFPFLYAPFGIWKKYRIVVHDMRYYDSGEKSISLTLKKIFIELSFKMADRIICISNFTRDRFFFHFSSIRLTDKVRVIYNPFVFLNINTPLKKDIAIYIGHIEKRKNIVGLLEFIKINADYEFFIIGYNKMGKYFLDAIIPLKNIKYFSNISEDKKYSILKEAKYFINLSHYEGFSYTPMEALQYNLNLMLSDIPVHQEIYKDYAIFPSDNFKLSEYKFENVELTESFKNNFTPSIYQNKIFEL